MFQGIGAPTSGPTPPPTPPPPVEATIPEEVTPLPPGGGIGGEKTTTEPTTHSSGQTTTTALDLVALGIDKKAVTSADLCKLVKGASRKKRQVGITDNGQKRNATKEESQNKNSTTENRTNQEKKLESDKGQNNKGKNSSNAIGNGSKSSTSNENSVRKSSEGGQGSSSSVSSSSTTPLVDLFVNPQKADVRKAFEEQTVKKYQDIFANINLKKVILCLHPIQHLKCLLCRPIMNSFDCCGPQSYPVPILRRQDVLHNILGLIDFRRQSSRNVFGTASRSIVHLCSRWHITQLSQMTIWQQITSPTLTCVMRV